MAKADLIAVFNERYQEIKAYISFLDNVEKSVQSGVPRLSGINEKITPDQQRILKSSLYLQLYNLVESTVSRCLEAVAQEIEKENRYPGELGEELRKEWVRSIARTHDDSLSSEKRLEAALIMCEKLLQKAPIVNFAIDRGGGGNWDDTSIKKICDRLGCTLNFSPNVEAAAKRHVRDKMGVMAFVKVLRNDLAHGSISFAECGDDVTVSELQAITTAVEGYLRETIESFINFINSDISKAGSQRKEEAV